MQFLLGLNTLKKRIFKSRQNSTLPTALSSSQHGIGLNTLPQELKFEILLAVACTGDADTLSSLSCITRDFSQASSQFRMRLSKQFLVAKAGPKCADLAVLLHLISSKTVRQFDPESLKTFLQNSDFPTMSLSELRAVGKTDDALRRIATALEHPLRFSGEQTRLQCCYLAFIMRWRYFDMFLPREGHAAKDWEFFGRQMVLLECIVKNIPAFTGVIAEKTLISASRILDMKVLLVSFRTSYRTSMRYQLQRCFEPSVVPSRDHLDIMFQLLWKYGTPVSLQHIIGSKAGERMHSKPELLLKAFDECVASCQGTDKGRYRAVKRFLRRWKKEMKRELKNSENRPGSVETKCKERTEPPPGTVPWWAAV